MPRKLGTLAWPKVMEKGQDKEEILIIILSEQLNKSQDAQILQFVYNLAIWRYDKMFYSSAICILQCIFNRSGVS